MNMVQDQRDQGVSSTTGCFLELVVAPVEESLSQWAVRHLFHLSPPPHVHSSVYCMASHSQPPPSFWVPAAAMTLEH